MRDSAARPMPDEPKRRRLWLALAPLVRRLPGAGRLKLAAAALPFGVAASTTTKIRAGWILGRDDR